MKIGDTVWFYSKPCTITQGVLADDPEGLLCVRVDTKYGPLYPRSDHCYPTKEECLQSRTIRDDMLKETELKSINSVDDLVRYMLRNLWGRNREVAQLKAKEFGIDLEV